MTLFSRLDPGLGLGAVGILEPAIRVGDVLAEVVVGLVGLAGLGIAICISAVVIASTRQTERAATRYAAMRNTSRDRSYRKAGAPGAALTRNEDENGTILVSGVVEADFDVGEADVPQGPEQIVARQPA